MRGLSRHSGTLGLPSSTEASAPSLPSSWPPFPPRMSSPHSSRYRRCQRSHQHKSNSINHFRFSFLLLSSVCSMPWSSCPWFSAYSGSWYLGILAAARSTQILRERRRHPLPPKLVLTIRIMFLTTKTNVIIFCHKAAHKQTLLYSKSICIYFKLSFGSCDRQAGTNFKAENLIVNHQDVHSLLFKYSLISCKQIKDNSQVLNEPNCSFPRMIGFYNKAEIAGSGW